MKLLIHTKEEYSLYKIMAAQGKTDSEICKAFLESHHQISGGMNMEVLIHIDLPPEDEVKSYRTWGEEEVNEPLELTTPLQNFPSLETDLFPAFRAFLKSEDYAFVARTPDPGGDILNFCKAPPVVSKEFTDKQNAITLYMEQHGITEIRPTGNGIKIWHENGMIENIPFQTIPNNLNYPHYLEEQEMGVTA